LFYRPSNSADDVTLPVTADATGQMTVPTAKLKRGNYSVLVDWAGSGKTYFSKLTLFVQ
jgi:hypothetical protein